MTSPNDNSPEALEALRLPDLQARYAEVVGEPTRCPNRTYLLRRIGEALDASEESISSVEESPEAQDIEPTEPAPAESEAVIVAKWRARYIEVVGRPTRSNNIRYLKWKIRQAERGLVPVGPSHQRQSEAEHKVVPLRLAVEAIEGLDQARERQGLKSRMELFRRALHLYLTSVGETAAAEPFSPQS